MLTHIDEKGNAKIVDISKKNKTKRAAVASGKIYVTKKIFEQIKFNTNTKGDILTVAKLAGIMAGKNTSSIIPLCHQINLENIDLVFELNQADGYIKATSSVKCCEKTGAEMEALVATSVSLLTIYDMTKAINKIEKIIFFMNNN